MKLQIIHNLFMTIANANFSATNISNAIIKIYQDKSIDELLSLEMIENLNADKHSLQELVIYGLKGMSAYLYHALQLGFESEELFDFVSDTLGYLTQEHSLEEYIALVDKTGAMGVKAMELPDRANTSKYGNPKITEVSIGEGISQGFSSQDTICTI